MEAKIALLKQELEELKAFEATAKTSRAKNVLSVEIHKIVTELSNLHELQTANMALANSLTTSSASAVSNKRYQVKLKDYGWGQSDKFVEFYINIPNVNQVPKEQVTCEFHEKSFVVTALDVNGKDYAFNINNLLHAIDCEKSKFKISSDKIIVYCAKNTTGNWDHVTETEKKGKDTKFKPNLDKNKDPNESLMEMMKQMYQDGDDEMKRTIAKAWTESQDKKK